MKKGFKESRKTYSKIYFGTMLLHLANTYLLLEVENEFFFYYSLLSTLVYLLLGILALYVERIGILFLICFGEILCYSVLGTIVIGYPAGYNLYLIGMIPITFYLGYMYSRKGSKSLLYVVIDVLIFIISTVISMNLMEPQITIHIKRLYALNSSVNLLLISGFFVTFTFNVDNNESLLEKENSILKKNANYDTLTGLRNRRTFNNVYMELKKRTILPLSVVMCDIDDFKKVNDTYGHDMGDIVLKRVGRIIKHDTFEGIQDIKCFRWGGEEFLILSALESETLYNKMEEIRQKVSEEIFEDEEGTFNVTISIGIASETNNDENIEKVIDNADKSLYESKHTGKNKITVKA